MEQTFSITDKHLTKNIRLYELLQSDTAVKLGIDNTPNGQQLTNLQFTAECVQAERDYLCEALGHEVQVLFNSGFRCDELNAKVGGSPASDHLKGLAVDPKYKRPGYVGYVPTALIIPLLEKSGLPFDQYIFYPNQTRFHAGYGNKMRRQILTKMNSGIYEPGLWPGERS